MRYLVEEPLEDGREWLHIMELKVVMGRSKKLIREWIDTGRFRRLRQTPSGYWQVHRSSLGGDGWPR